MNELSLNDALMPYLVEIASQPEAASTILSGGFGLRLKQAHLRASALPTLIPDVPEARATQDLDFFLSLQLWLGGREGALAFRAMLDRLGYTIRTHSWQFRKPLDEERFVTVDLQARTPHDDEPVKIGRKPNKTSQVGKGMRTDLAGYETPEGFAVEDSPLSLNIRHDETSGIVRLPHPYAWLNLKVKAAHDWLREDRGELAPRLLPDSDISTRLKHVFDVYLLTAMLTETELEEAEQMALTYAEHEQARAIRDLARELYATPTALGMTAIRSYAQLSFGRTLSIDHDLFFRDGLRPALGL